MEATRTLIARVRSRRTGGKERFGMMRKSILRAFVVMVFLAGGMFAIGGRAALAHADVESSEPAANATVDRAPSEVVIIFSAEIETGTTIEVLGPDDDSVAAGEAVIDLNDPNRQRVTVALLADLPDGVYTVNWTSASTDGHTETGSFVFTVAGGAKASPEASPVASPAALAGAALTEDEVKEEMHTIADQAQQQATIEAANTDGLDEGEFFFGVGVGAAAGLLIYLFWRKVRPSPEERVQAG